MKTSILSLLSVLAFLQACDTENGTTQLKEPVLVLPETPFEYNAGVQNELPTLGRVLFYDKKLSLNNSISCGSCHLQSLAFSDNEAFSRGFENKLTSRNSLPIQNVGPSFNIGNKALFWDGRENNLNTMVMRPIANHIEMGMDDMDALSEKLAALPYYQDLFTAAYGSPEVSPEKISEALSFFLSSITSRNTKFDRTRNAEATLSALELQGQQLFMETYDCNQCHQVTDPEGYIFAGTFSNIGLDEVYADNGLGGVTRNPADNGRFKIPSLRNVALTAPYMHDGRFQTLDEVIEHYSIGIEDNENLDPRLKEGDEPMVLNITEQETEALKAFMLTLTDHEMVSAEKFSDPFKIQ